jgi:hypothetical protein
MGFLDHLAHMCSITETRQALKLRKKRPLQVSEMDFVWIGNPINFFLFVKEVS